MGRRNYAHMMLTCHRGINEQRDLAAPEECAEALNVWSPAGKIEQRPGFEGVQRLVSGDSQSGIGSHGQTYLSENAAGTVAMAAVGSTLSLNNWAVGEHWYMGFPSPLYVYSFGTQLITGLRPNISGMNSNASGFKAHYWNGDEWKYIAVTESESYYGGQWTGGHLGGSNNRLHFVPPGDWAEKSIAVTGGSPQTAYWIRLTITEAALSGSTELTNDSATQHLRSPALNEISGMFVAQFPTVRRYTYLTVKGGFYTTYRQAHDFFQRDANVNAGYGRATEQSLATHAAVPQFNEGFLAYGGEVVSYKAHEDWDLSFGGIQDILAQVDTSDASIGRSAPFDSSTIHLMSEFPKGRYIAFFANRLWIAGMDNEPFTVRWSGPVPHYRVWPFTSYANLMEDDNSPVTGMAPLGEHMVVFKQDSIWILVAAGENPDTANANYLPIRMVAGVGCVSHSSIQQVRGSLVFLAEDGVYSFDGTPNITKISDKIEKTIGSIVPSRRAFAASVNWKTKSCYLLSVAVDGSYDNNRTLVFDYKNNAWWIWDIPAGIWMKDEDQYDDERLFFADKNGLVYHLGSGNHDHGAAIESSFMTQRLGEGENVRHTLRQVEVTSTNLTGNLGIAVRANDDELGETPGVLAVGDTADPVYGVAVDGVDKYALERYRARRIGFRKQGDWIQVKVTHSDKNKPMSVRSVDLGFLPGPRR